MSRVAIFVDAGYLFAQGSTALVGAKQPRSSIRLNETAALAELKAAAEAKADGCSILRTYWYDGIIGFKGPTLEQERLGLTDNVKLRLGLINSAGQQKGVDSLIVTDLIDLARNRAVTDAVLLSGDEDVRIGVQIAQQFGVRVHLIGIAPARGSQSKTLMQEADTTTEWDKATVTKFLSIAPSSQVAAASMGSTSATTSKSSTSPTGTQPGLTLTAALSKEVDQAAQQFASELDTTEVTHLKAHFQSKSTIPPEYDGRLLARCRTAANRNLSLDERRLVRAKFRSLIK